MIGPIEEGIVAPTRHGEISRAILEMKKGESRVIAGVPRVRIYKIAYRYGASVSVKPEGDGWRVWRRA